MKKYFPIIRFSVELNAIYVEINEYNSNYWSTFLCIIWFTITAVISSFLYLVLFTKVPIIIYLIICFVFILFSLILILIIRISSAIYIESNNSYLLLNSLFCRMTTKSFALKMKVWIIIIFEIINNSIP